ncbi:Uncharacterised protein [Haemophilus parainfluenzae]|uniref:Lipoprotein n=1 Tax=Haemophilus parainfluenzae TaxID=729 RepID=A0A3S4WS70_HAEPA|nr:hypothetical protein [Haemophilus parainfluenzae]VEI30375.1 Uncharacterised protein [Haemophilus parainfluenzae]DAP67013.1 MAG TPA: protein of unknown function (DUF4969) [Caudoviricetes sp.]
MKKILSMLLTGALACLLSSCSEEQDSNAPTSSEISDVKLNLYKLLPKDSDKAATCESRKIGEHYYLACNYIAIGQSPSSLYVFYYDKVKDPVKRFYALNGKAMSLYDEELKYVSMLGNYKDTFGLPLPESINMGEVMKEFEFMRK